MAVVLVDGIMVWVGVGDNNNRGGGSDVDGGDMVVVMLVEQQRGFIEDIFISQIEYLESTNECFGCSKTRGEQNQGRGGENHEGMPFSAD